MSAIYIMLPVSLLLAGFFLAAYIWSVRSGQFEDTETPAMRILPEDKPISVASAILADVEPGILPGGNNAAKAKAADPLGAPSISSSNPGGKMPPSTSGRMPDATLTKASDFESKNRNTPP